MKCEIPSDNTCPENQGEKINSLLFKVLFHYGINLQGKGLFYVCFSNMEEYKFCPALGLHVNYTLCLVFSSKLGSQKTVLPPFLFHICLQWAEKAASHSTKEMKCFTMGFMKYHETKCLKSIPVH